MCQITLYRPDGATVRFDLFARESVSHNLLITGESGSGKSTCAASLAASAATQGHVVRIATTGDDYGEVVQQFGGHRERFSVFRPVSLNPFSSVTSWENERLGVNAVFSNIVRQSLGNTHPLLHEVLEYLQEAVGTSWANYLHQSDVVTVFRTLETCRGIPSAIQSLAEKALTPFLPDEVYEGWLTGPAVSLDDHLNLFNLENLQVCEPLFKAVVPALLHAFSTDTAHEQKGRYRLIILDDLWSLHVPTATMHRLLRCGEQPDTGVIPVVNSFVDLRHMTSGKIVAAHCPNRIFYPSPAMSLNYELLVEAGIPESAIDLLDTPQGRTQHFFYLTSLKGVYSLGKSQPHPV